MASLLDWFGKTVGDTANNVGHFLNDTGKNVGNAVNSFNQTPQHPTQPVQRPVQQVRPNVVQPNFGIKAPQLNIKVPKIQAPAPTLKMGQPNNNWNPSAVLGGAVNAVNDTIVKPTVTSIVNTGGNIYKGMHANDMSNMQNAFQKDAQTNLKNINQAAQSGKITWDQAKQASNQIMKGVNKIGSESNKATKAFTSIDPTKAAADAAQTYLTLATLGKGKQVVDALGTPVVAPLLERLGQNTASNALIGGVFNALSQVSQTGSKTTLPELATATGTGALFGGALGAGGTLAGPAIKGAYNGAKNVTTKLVTAVKNIPESKAFNSYVDYLNRPMPTGSNSGGHKIPFTSKNQSELPLETPSIPEIPNVAKVKSELSQKESTIPQTQVNPGQSTPVPPKSVKTVSPSTINTSSESIINPQDYIKQQYKMQESARKQGNPTLPSMARTEVSTKLIDSLSPIEKKMNQAIADGANIPLRRNITPQLDRALRADSIAGQYIKDNGLAKVIQNVPDTKALDQYLIAKHAVDLEANGVKTGRNLTKDSQLVASLQDTYEPFAQEVMRYNRQLLDKAVGYGLVSKETAAILKEKYPNYVPASRIFGENELNGFNGTGSGNASISTQSAVQRIKGSERQIESPLASIVNKTNDVIRQGERNKAASILASYKDLPGNPFDITPLRTAENVKARIDLYSQSKDLKPIQNKLIRMERTQKGWANRLQSEINKLNKTALNKSLKTPSNEVSSGFLVDQLNKLKTRDTKSFINTLVNAPKSEVEALKRKIATRDNKLGPILDQVEGIRNVVEGVRNTRETLRLEALGYKDLNAVNKPTISTFKDGIKEVYETTPEIAAAAKSLNKEQIGIIGKIVRVPTRLLRLGATGVNSGFALANITKDVVSAFINSEHPIKSSALNLPVLKEASSAALYHGGKSYAELVREGAGGTSFDIARDAPVATIKNIRAGKNVGTKALYTVTHPAELVRAVENTIGRSEEFTRAMQYYGNKGAALDNGMSKADAITYGANAARNNTVNFARHGEYGAVLNSALPYLNAGIQGSRTLLRNIKNRPAQTMTKVAILGLLPAMTTTAWNLSDPKRKQAYNDISDYEKQNNLIIVPPNPVKDQKTGRWNVIKIPVSQEIANLNNIARNGVEGAMSNKNFNVGEMLGDLIGTTTSINAQNPRQIANQITPQALKPGVEAITNQNLYTGNKIVPDSQKNLPANEQYGNYTSGTAKTIGNLTGLSPRIIDNTIRTSMGGAGQNAVFASDSALAAAGVIKPTEVQGKDIQSSITDRFTSAAGRPVTDYIAQSYDKYKSQLVKTPEYQALNQVDRAKALNRLQTDVTALEYAKNDANNPNNGYTPKNLTSNQVALKNGTKTMASYTTTNANADPKSTYQAHLASFNQGVKDGTITGPDVMTKQKALSKEEITSQYSSEVNDFYKLSNADKSAYFKSDPAKAKQLYDKAKEMESKLVGKGLAKAKSTGTKKSGSKKSSATSQITAGKMLAKYEKIAQGIKPPKVTGAPKIKSAQFKGLASTGTPLKKYTVIAPRTVKKKGMVA